MRNNKASGFTLIEVMVAVLILGLAAAALVQTATTALSQQQYLQSQTIAVLLAEQKLQSLHLEKKLPNGSWPALGEKRSRVSNGNGEFELRTNITSTENKALRRVVVEVIDENSEQKLTSLVGFIGQW